MISAVRQSASSLRQLSLVAIIALGIAASARAENWVLKHRSAEGDVFLDVDSIRVSRGLTHFTYRRKMEEFWRETCKDYNISSDACPAASVSFVAVNCEDRAHAEYARTTFSSEGKAIRKAGNTWVYRREEWVFFPLRPESYRGKLIDHACELSNAKAATVTPPPTPERRTSPNRPDAQIEKTGSGFSIDREGTVITNQHVVKGCTNFEVRHGSDRYAARLIAQDERFDLAALRAAGPVPIAALRAGAIEVGEAIYVAGFPLAGLLAADMNFTNGVVANVAGVAGNLAHLQITAPVQQGNSGGPLLDQSGNVVGVVVGKLNAIRVAGATGDIPQNVNFAIKVDVLRMFLDANRIAHTTTSSTTRLDSVQVAKKARSVTVQVTCK